MFYKQSDLEAGIKDEMEHTGDRDLATKIAVDHLLQDKDYYSKLKAAGLEQEGAMTPAELGLEEDLTIVASDEELGEQPELASSDLGAETPKPLKSSQIDAPETKVINNKNTVGYEKTPSMAGSSNCNSDASDYFGDKISKALAPEIPRVREFIPANVSEGGASLKKK